jgi:hypothetical protein
MDSISGPICFEIRPADFTLKTLLKTACAYNGLMSEDNPNDGERRPHRPDIPAVRLQDNGTALKLGSSPSSH